ncbi:MAG: amino acid permease [Chloroflexota bacterium]|nr:amino acid permease [Chloroflexota bacterium]
MSTLKAQHTSSSLPPTLGEPLRSVQRTDELLPRTLSRVDLLTIFTAIVFFITYIQGTLPNGNLGIYIYWLTGALALFLPSAIVVRQFNHFMAVDGSIYVWTQRAFGSLWGFFAGFCSWFPGILVLLFISSLVTSLIQDTGILFAGPHARWLAEPWQQGLVIVPFLALTGTLALLPLRPIMRLAQATLLLYGAGALLIGAAGVTWLLQGHALHVPTLNGDAIYGQQSNILFSAILFTLLALGIPCNVAAEMKKHDDCNSILGPGVPLAVIAYLLGLFGLLVATLQGHSTLATPVLSLLNSVFGAPLTIVVALLFIAFVLMIAVICNIAFSRTLFAFALDHRLPLRFASMNRHGAPSFAISIQTGVVLLIAIYGAFIGPWLYDEGLAHTHRVYTVTMASLSILWCISMLILFLDLPVLLYHFRDLIAQHPTILATPRWLLYLCCAVGGLASLVAICITFTISYDEVLIPDRDWVIYMSISTLVPLFIGLLGAAYPRMLRGLHEQTAVATENARLYHELREAYARLSELDKLKDAFIATASHELRTPLTVVQGYLELLCQLENLDPQTRRSFLYKAHYACEELVLLQANIMDASQLHVDAAALHLTRIPLKGICSDIVELFEPWILKEQRQVEVDIAPEIVVQADEMRLKQVLRNLFANALRYSAETTPIRIVATVEEAQSMARISVIDRGAGIPLDKQQVIFERFVRLERDMHGLHRGSGLGLSITRQLVEAMQGTITLTSSGIAGEGSTFSFTLPLAPSPA